MSTRSRSKRRHGLRTLFYGALVALPVGVGFAAGMTMDMESPRNVAASMTPSPSSAVASVSPSMVPALSFIPRPNGPANLLVMACDVDNEEHGGKTLMGLRGN